METGAQKQKREQDWLNALKVGDEVTYKIGYGSTSVIDIIVRVTPTLFVLKTGKKIRRKDGHQQGDGYHRALIQPLTDEVRAEVEERILRDRARHFDYSQMSVANLRRISAVIADEVEMRKRLETGEEA